MNLYLSKTKQNHQQIEESFKNTSFDKQIVYNHDDQIHQKLSSPQSQQQQGIKFNESIQKSNMYHKNKKISKSFGIQLIDNEEQSFGSNREIQLPQTQNYHKKQSSQQINLKYLASQTNNKVCIAEEQGKFGSTNDQFSSKTHYDSTLTSSTMNQRSSSRLRFIGSQHKLEQPIKMMMENNSVQILPKYKNSELRSSMDIIKKDHNNKDNYYNDNRAEQNIKKYLQSRINKNSLENEQNTVRKCVSTKEIYIPKIEQFQSPQSIIPDLLNKNQLTLNTNYPTSSEHKFLTPIVNHTIYQSTLSPLKQSQSNIFDKQKMDKSLFSSTNKKYGNSHVIINTGSPVIKAQPYNNNQFNSEEQKDTLNHQFFQQMRDSPLSYNQLLNRQDGFASLRGSSNQSLFHKGNNNNQRQFNNDVHHKKSVLQNIFLKDKDQMSLNDINSKYRKVPDTHSSQNNIQLHQNQINTNHVGQNNQHLQFPASQKELAEFQKLQEQNELRFTKQQSQNKNEEKQDEQKINSRENQSSLEKKHIMQNKHKSIFKNDSCDSLRIMELVRDRNEQMNLQKEIQNQNMMKQESLQSANLKYLIRQNLIRKISNSPSKVNLIKESMKEQQFIRITDPSDITKHRKIFQSSNNLPAPTHISQQQIGTINIIPSNIKCKTIQNWNTSGSINEINFNHPSSTREKQSLKEIKRTTMRGCDTLKSIGSYMIEDEDHGNSVNNLHNIVDNKIISEENQRMKEKNNKDLIYYTNLVDYLQQQKSNIRQSLEEFLSSRPRIVKGIARNCLMDQEQFLFFIMNFIQFCIDDMFEEFKRNYELKLSHSVFTFSNGLIPDQQQDQNNSKNNITFKFSQKIPEEIMKQVVEVILNCLERQHDNFKQQNINFQNCEKNSSINLIKQSLIDFDEAKLNQIDDGLQVFYKKIEKNVVKYLNPETIIDRLGGFARLRQLIVQGIKIFNGYINSASKMNHIEEDDSNLVDKYLMPGFCALVNNDNETLLMLINIFKKHKNYFSHYDFFTIKKIIWDSLSSIKLDPKLKIQVILQIENIRYEFFDHPFENRTRELGNNMMKSYELCNYFRNPNPYENACFLTSLIPVLYKNKSYTQFYESYQSKLKFSLNYRFFEHLQKFLIDELKDADVKSILDLSIRMQKLRIRAGVSFNFFTIINEDTETFFAQLLPYLSNWIQRYNLSQMDAKTQDFKFLELFLKWSLNKQDYYSILDSEPCLMHYAINEFMIQFWIKGIAAYFNEKDIPQNKHKYFTSFLSQYLLFKKDEEQQSHETINQNTPTSMTNSQKFKK